MESQTKSMIAGGWYRVWRGSRKHFFLAPGYTKTACKKSFNMITELRMTGLPLCTKCKQWVDENPMVTRLRNKEN